MKRLYIQPTIKVRKIQTPRLMAGSPTVSNDKGLSDDWGGAKQGGLFDDSPSEEENYDNSEW